MYSIRRATASDISIIADHREAMFREMGTEGDYEAMRPALTEWLGHAIPSELYRAWVVCNEDGEVVGGGGLVLHVRAPGPKSLETQTGYVYNVYVDPSHRRHGLARRIMEAIHAWCQETGVRQISLHASPFGKPLYDSMGYEPTNEMRIRLRS